jgi:hypothetical protein
MQIRQSAKAMMLPIFTSGRDKDIALWGNGECPLER